MMKRWISVVLALAAAWIAAAEETAPLFRVGLMTDTHWTEDAKSFARTEAALRIMKREKVDMICNLGDIADKHIVSAYRYYRNELFPKVFPENPPREIFVYANHDALNPKGVAGGGANRKDIPGYFAAMRRELGIPHAPDDRVVFKGYPFVIFQQFVPQETMEKMLADTAREFPEGPIFVLDHVPAPKADAEKNNKRRVVYGKYPRVVHLYGHVHQPLRDENAIWQGTHTEVGAGCLQNWRGYIVGTSPASKDCFEFAIMDVHKDKLVFRRFSTEDGRECKSPWGVPLPFDPATAPYAPARRAAATPAPEFASGAKLEIKPNKPFSALFVTWPEAGQGGEVYKYYVWIAVKEGTDGTFRKFARRDSYSEFYLAENKRKGKLTQRISNGYFEPGREYMICVIPVGFFGREGEPLIGEFTAPADVRKAETVFESRDPMKELVFASGLAGKKSLEIENGFYRHSGNNARLIIPKKHWAGKKGTRFRFTVDMDVRQSPLGRGWTMVLRNPKPMHNANNRLLVENGIGCRYVIEFGKRNEKYFYDLLIREGAPGMIRFNYVKIEKLK